MSGRFVLALPPPAGPWEELAREALAFLIGLGLDDFREAMHTLLFPREQGFLAAGGEWQHGDVFQRALIADALCDAADLTAGQLSPLIEREADHLLGCRCRAGAGGWRYFPELPELPPDADDLAQVMQVLLRCGRATAAREHCEGPLQVLLRDNAHGDGSFETWIVPAAGRTPEQELQARWIEQAWGAGPDVEVVANLLFALTLYDPDRFRHDIQRGAAWIEAALQPSGEWRSSWYEGPFYGTYVCLRLLAAARRPASPARDAALGFLRRSQRADGSWGATPEPLSTALALLGLATAPGGSADAERAGKAQAFLLRACNQGPSWPPSPFIRMELGRSGGRVHQVLRFGCRAVTAAYVLKAAAAWHRRAAACPSTPFRR